MLCFAKKVNAYKTGNSVWCWKYFRAANWGSWGQRAATLEGVPSVSKDR